MPNKENLDFGGKKIFEVFIVLKVLPWFTHSFPITGLDLYWATFYLAG